MSWVHPQDPMHLRGLEMACPIQMCQKEVQTCMLTIKLKMPWPFMTTKVSLKTHEPNKQQNSNKTINHQKQTMSNGTKLVRELM
jgi:hypothetical protein